MTFINPLLASEIQHMPSLNFFRFGDLLVLDYQGNVRVRLATQRIYPRKFNLRLPTSPFGQALQCRYSLVV